MVAAEKEVVAAEEEEVAAEEEVAGMVVTVGQETGTVLTLTVATTTLPGGMSATGVRHPDLKVLVVEVEAEAAEVVSRHSFRFGQRK